MKQKSKLIALNICFFTLGFSFSQKIEFNSNSIATELTQSEKVELKVNNERNQLQILDFEILLSTISVETEGLKRMGLEMNKENQVTNSKINFREISVEEELKRKGLKNNK